MYKITSNSRRITQSILNEAYKWTYKKVADGEYEYNKSIEAMELAVKIQDERRMSAESYEKFVDLFDKSPFSYMTYKSKHRNSKYITTDNLMNYFIEFNGNVLPMGFIVYYFEDDYETKEEISELIKKFVNNEKDELSVYAKRELMRKDVDNKKLVEHNPQVFKTPISFFVSNAFRILLWIAAIVIFNAFCSATHFLSILADFVFKAQFAANELITGDYTAITSYFANFDFQGVVTAVERVTYGEYFRYFAAHAVVNFFLFIFIIRYTIKVIKFIIALAHIIKFRVEIARQAKFKDMLEDGGIQQFQEYFDEISDDLAANETITDDLCERIPAVKKQYNAVMNYNSRETAEKIKKLHGKFVFKSVTLNYATEQGLVKAKKTWRKGFISAIFWLTAFAIINVPSLYENILPTIENMLSNIFG